MLTRRTLLLMLSASAIAAACAPGAAPEPPVSASAARTTLRFSGSGSAMPAAQKLGEGYESQASGVRLEFLGGTNSGGAIRGVLDGALDVAVTNRPLTEAEAREPLVYHPFARDAVVFAVHQTAPVRSLSTADIRDIYSGGVSNWRDVSSSDAPIIVLDRDEDESQRKLALVPLMGGRSVIPTAVTLTSAGGMLSSLDSLPSSIGYSSLGLLRLRAPKHVVPLMLDDIKPDRASVASGAYPWSLTFGFVTRTDAPQATHEFVSHALRAAPSILPAFDYAPVNG